MEKKKNLQIAIMVSHIFQWLLEVISLEGRLCLTLSPYNKSSVRQYGQRTVAVPHTKKRKVAFIIESSSIFKKRIQYKYKVRGEWTVL